MRTEKVKTSRKLKTAKELDLAREDDRITVEDGRAVLIEEVSRPETWEECLEAVNQNKKKAVSLFWKSLKLNVVQANAGRYIEEAIGRREKKIKVTEGQLEALAFSQGISVAELKDTLGI